MQKVLCKLLYNSKKLSTPREKKLSVEIVYLFVKRLKVNHCANIQQIFDLYRACSDLVGQRILCCTKLGVEPEVRARSNIN